MSNSFSPKKVSTVLNQETLERLLTGLRQPFSIAVLASLGLHGLLWAALPNMLAETAKEPDTKQRVQVVELSPAEQGQLPSLGLNAVPPTLLPATPSKPAQSTTKLPDPKLYNDPSLYNFGSIQPPPPDVFPSFNLPPTTFDFNPPPTKQPPKAATPPKVPVGPSKAPTAPSTPPTDKTPPGVAGESTAPVRPEKLSSEQLAALQKDAERSRQLRSLYAFNGPTTQDKALEVVQANATTFQAVVAKTTKGDAYDDTRFTKTPEKVTDLFPKEACPFVGGVRQASFGAIVKPDGTLAELPTVLLPSGYQGLDDAAINDISRVIKSKKFGEGGKFQLIRFDYVFDPKASCPNPSKPA